MTKTVNSKYVIFACGESAGPVLPLLTVAKLWCLQDPSLKPVFIDVRKSVASRIIPKHGYVFKSIITGKLRRYWTVKNVLTPFKLLFGFIQSLFILIRLKPIVVVGAGGYVQLPVVLAAWLLRIPRIVHQQDITPTLANKLCAPFSNKITVSFEKSLKDFSQGLGFSKNYAKYHKVEWTGNPCDAENKPKEEAQKLFKLDPSWPTVLLIGGGSGANALNHALMHNLPELLKVAQVIHSTGVGKRVQPPIDLPAVHDRYHQYEFIEHISEALSVADIVITRAGMYTITSLAKLSKLSIIVPMPNSHQELNALYVYERNAAVVIDQTDITPETFARLVRKLLFDVHLQKQLRTNIHAIMPQHAAENMLKVILELTHNGK